MTNLFFSADDALRRTSRLRARAAREDDARLLEAAALILTGVTASLLTNLLRLRLGIPGSSIVFAVFPMAFGFALVPRRGAGALMSIAALATTAALWLTGARIDGVGAQTSLLLTGPLLDVALRWANRGWRLYGAFVLAGAAGNAAAFFVRGGAKLLGLGVGRGGRRFDAWWPQAVVTYAAAGVIAGLIGALAWFHFREPAEPGDRVVRR